jgi:hypothetical protein
MASARSSLLRDYRTITKRKVLSPGTLGSSAQTIARKSLDAEFDSMVGKYNDGLVSNAEFLTFLQSSLNNKYFTAQEKVDIQDKIRDFGVRVNVEKMQANYDNASGQDRVTAAQSLASYYQQYAATLQSDTPAQSQALQQYANWNAKATAEQDTINRNDRKLSRYRLLSEVSQMEGGTMEKLQKQYEAYVKMAEEAYSDGEEAEGVKYETLANDIANTKAPKLQESLQNEQLNSNKKELQSQYYQIQDAYHDGEIGAQEAAQLVRQIDRAATELGDGSLLQSINNFADSLQKDIESGVTRGDVEGLPYFQRDTKNGTQLLSIRQMKAVFQNEDDVFRQELMRIQQNPNAYERVARTALLYASYLYGKAPDESDTEGWVGVKNRQGVIDQWKQLIPEKEETYNNNQRDEATKLMTKENDFSQIMAQLQSIPPEVLDNMSIDGVPLSQIVDSISRGVPTSLITPPTMGNQYGVLVGYDKSGRPYEKLVALNSQTTDVDPVTGQQINQGTFIGKDIAQTPDGKYIKLQPHYADAASQSQNLPDFYYGEYNGQLYTKSLGEESMSPASESSLQNESIASWYETQKATEAERMSQFESYTKPIGPEGPPAGYFETRRAIEAYKARPDVQTDIANFEATGEKAPEVVPPIAQSLGQFSTAGRGVGFADLYSPKNDLNLSNYSYTLPQTQMSYTPIPSYNVTPSTTWKDVPQSNQIYNAGTTPQNNLQSSGIKLDLGLPNIQNDLNLLPATQTPQQDDSWLKKAGTAVGNVVSGIGSFLNKLNPFK